MSEKQEKIKTELINNNKLLPESWSWQEDVKGLFTYEKSGKKRYGLIKECQNCDRQFLVRKDWFDKSIACSKLCNSILRQNRTEVSCSWCEKKFNRTLSKLKNSKHGFQFCNRICKEKAQQIGGIQEIHPSHYKDGYSNYSERAFKEYGCKCVDCNITMKSFLQVHHKDGKRDNGDIKNLEIVCAIHHMLRHMVFRNNKWIIDFKELTDFDDLEILKKELNKQL